MLTLSRRAARLLPLLLTLCAFALWTPAQAQSALKVAVIGAEANSSWNNDVKSKLVSTGLFGSVDVVNCISGTPSLATLLTYNSVLVYSDSRFWSASALGDVLAEYLHAGGGIVVSVFANSSIPILGRFSSDNDYCLAPASQTQGNRLTLGSYDANSPLMAGVTTFDGGSSTYRSTGTPVPGAMVVASWSNGSPLVLTRDIGGVHRVDLNFFPPSAAVRSDFWKTTTNGARLMANALIYTATPAGPPEFTVGMVDTKAHARAVLTGYVTLPTPAPAGGETVSLRSDKPLVTVPATVVVPEGQSSVTFPVRTDATPAVYAQTAIVTPTIFATDGALASEIDLTILPANTARADAFVQDGTLSDTNFGTVRELQISSDGVGGSGNNRVAYLRFRVGGFSTVSKARLRVDARVIDGGTATLGVYAVPDNHWQQDTLTFNSRPVIGELLKPVTVTGTTLTHYNIDVTDYVRAAQARGKDVLSFALQLTQPSASVVSVISSETQDGPFRKAQLVVQGN